jgi:putative transposase
MVQERLGLSQRRACRIVGQHRSTQRHPAATDPDGDLRRRLRRFAKAHPRWGCRRAHAVLHREGHPVNRKKVQRLWREEGLRVPARRRKRQRLGDSADRLRATRPEHVWVLDYQFDVIATGRTIKLLHVVDEFTRESLAELVEHSIDADATVACLDKIAVGRGRHPAFVCCDNGPELPAHALRDWCRFAGTATRYIEPGSPWENPWVESYGSRIRDELLAIEQFDTLLQAQVLVADWRIQYNTYRPHSALGMLTPAHFANQWRQTNQPQLSYRVDQPTGSGHPPYRRRRGRRTRTLCQNLPLEPRCHRPKCRSGRIHVS